MHLLTTGVVNPLTRWRFLAYGLMIFFLTSADATMSYMAPVIMQHRLGATTMGLVLSTSSAMGCLTDFTLARLFGRKRADFFIRLVLGLFWLFPAIMFCFSSIPMFVLAMVIWGVYYEAIVFSNYHAVHEFVAPSAHAWAWGVVTTIRSVGWVIGPLVAGMIVEQNQTLPLLLAVVLYSVAALVYLTQKLLFRPLKQAAVSNKKVATSHSFRQELKIWQTYGRIIWPLLGLMFLIVVVDATFFSIGPVYGEGLAATHPLGGLFITMYTVPSVVLGMLTGVLARPLGKKRTAFVAGVLAGVGLITMSQMGSVPLILVTTFLASCGLSLIFPELSAVFEDFVARSRQTGNDLVGLAAISSSAAYVLGPIAAGFLSDHIGSQSVFGVWGLAILFLSVMAFVVVPRKIKLPQQKLIRTLRVRRHR